MGYFQGTFETQKHIVVDKIYVANKENAGNLLCMNTAKELRLINFEKLNVNNTKIKNTIDHSVNKETHMLNDANCSQEFKSSIQKLVCEFSDIFEGRGKLLNYKCKLYVEESVKPIAQKMRRYPYHLRKQIKEELKRLENEDIIEKVEGPQEWISNLVVVPKANGKVRLCLDARLINTAIKREKYPIPTLDSIVDDMHGAKLFAKLDLKEAYTQLVLDEESRKITNFNTDEGVYRHKRLVYGINNSFEIFQRSMEQSFGKIDGVKFISDDVIIYAVDEIELTERLRTIFVKCRSLGIKLNKAKCVFAQRKLKFFGIEISNKGINPDPMKVTAIKEATRPRSISELRSFLGLCTYVSRFIANFSEKTAELRELLKGNKKFEWTEKHQKSFNLLKQELSCDTVLAFYDPTKEVRLVTDASGHALGGVLLQKESTQGVYRPICYISRTLTPAELNYSSIEKEALGLVWGIEKLHLYLYGKSFEVVSDHKPLKFIFSPNAKLNPRIARWQIKLQAYQFKVLYEKGETNIADFLSRNGADMNNDDINDYETCLYLNFLSESHTPKAISLEEIRTATSNDTEIIAVQNALLTGRWHSNPLLSHYKFIHDELSYHNGILLRGEKIVLPFELRRRALEIVHEGHLGISRCKALLRQKLYWPGLDKDTVKFINSCIPCQANVNEPTPEPIRMSDLPSEPWSEIAIDFCGRLPTGEMLLVIIDRYSRYPIVEIMKTTTTAAVTNRLSNIFAMFGFPNRLWSDNGPPFQSRQFNSFLKHFGIHHKKVTPRYPQANGTIERFMRVISKALKTGNFNERNWREELQNKLLNYRCSPHSITGKTPSELFFNRTIQNKLPSITVDKPKFDREFRQRQAEKYHKAAKRFNKTRNVSLKDIAVGDKVLLKRDNKGDKFDSKFYSTIYTVISRKGALVTIEDTQNNQLARNVAAVKRINQQQEIDNTNDSGQTTRETKRKEYPKRKRKQTMRY